MAAAIVLTLQNCGAKIAVGSMGQACARTAPEDVNGELNANAAIGLPYDPENAHVSRIPRRRQRHLPQKSSPAIVSRRLPTWYRTIERPLARPILAVLP